MIDFTNEKINKFKYYGGKNGNKICINYNNKDYMLKFPSPKESNDSYTNSTISEYLSCKILKSIGLNAQDTLIGIYKVNEKEKIVCACNDFVEEHYKLKEFAELKNSQISTSKNGYGTDLEEVLETINEQNILQKNELKEFFWEMFIGDALVGNFDRHNGNWGFLINEKEEKIKIAPIYDCASCLYPELDENALENILNDEKEILKRVYTFPNSALRIDDKKINYYDYITSLKNEDCNNALLKIFPKIDLNIINSIIDNTDLISKTRKSFYKKMIYERYNRILKETYIKLKKGSE